MWEKGKKICKLCPASIMHNRKGQIGFCYSPRVFCTYLKKWGGKWEAQSVVIIYKAGRQIYCPVYSWQKRLHYSCSWQASVVNVQQSLSHNMDWAASDQHNLVITSSCHISWSEHVTCCSFWTGQEGRRGEAAVSGYSTLPLPRCPALPMLLRASFPPPKKTCRMPSEQ